MWLICTPRGPGRGLKLKGEVRSNFKTLNLLCLLSKLKSIVIFSILIKSFIRYLFDLKIKSDIWITCFGVKVQYKHEYSDFINFPVKSPTLFI